MTVPSTAVPSTALPATAGPSTAVPTVDLEPSLVRRNTYLSRWRLGYVDLAAVLCLLIAVLLLLPSRLIVPELTDFGRPAIAVSLALAVWWFVARLSPTLTMTGPQPIRWAALAFLVATLAAYVAGYLRGLPTLEANGADRAVIGTCAYLGAMVMTADGIANRYRLNLVLRVFIWAAAGMALIGMVQFVFAIDVTQYLLLPGLTLQDDLVGFEERGDAGFVRVASTATHYIEFSAVMAIAVPFAIHYARFGETRLQRQLAGTVAVLTAAVIPMTLSRTGILALGIVILAMLPAWSWRLRFNFAVVGAAMVAVFVVLQPGLLGTLRSMFVSIFTGEDISIQGRTDDVSAVSEYFAQRPIFGRGPGTFIPTLYQFLDNQWYGTLIESGLVGLVALAGLHITAIALAAIARHRATHEADRHLCTALIATQLAAIVCGFTFDTLGFASFFLMVMVLAGAAGVMWRLTHPARTIRTAVARQR